MRYICLFLVLFASNYLFADEVSVNQARKIAVDFFSAKMQTRSGTPQLQLVWDGESAATRSTAAPAFYVFNRTDGEGFVIVAGDDVVMPILGYSFSNHFTLENMPPNLLGWMDGLRNQVNITRNERSAGSSSVSEAWTRVSDAADSQEVNLSTALWDQQAPFNRLSPMTSSGKAITGCVATAMAIVMQYHRWPDQGEGTVPAYKLNDKDKTQIPSKTFDTPYDWDKMPINVNQNSDTGIKDEVATLMYDCGIIAKSQFGNKSTSAYYSEALEGMVNYMKYNKGAYIRDRWTREWDEWYQMLRTELNNKRPVLYTGDTKSGGGHMFVIDGYKSEDYFHVNWGWGGKSNGFYLLSIMAPLNVGSGGSSGGYTQNQSAFFNLMPDRDGTSTLTDNLSLVKKEVNGVSYEGLIMGVKDVQPNQEFTVSVGAIRNIGRSYFNGKIKIALVGKDGTVKEDISEEFTIQYNAGSYGAKEDCPCKITQPIKKGDRIRVYYKGKNTADWEYLRGGPAVTSEIIIKEEDMPLERATSFTYDKLNKRITLKTYPQVDYQVLSASDKKLLFSGATDNTNLAIQIDINGLTNGEYIIVLRKKIEDVDEYEEKELRFAIGNKK